MASSREETRPLVISKGGPTPPASRPKLATSHLAAGPKHAVAIVVFVVKEAVDGEGSRPVQGGDAGAHKRYTQISLIYYKIEISVQT